MMNGFKDLHNEFLQKVRLEIDRHGMDLYVMRNGYQWLGVPVDDELLEQIESVIQEYFGE